MGVERRRKKHFDRERNREREIERDGEIEADNNCLFKGNLNKNLPFAQVACGKRNAVAHSRQMLHATLYAASRAGNCRGQRDGGGEVIQLTGRAYEKLLGRGT